MLKTRICDLFGYRIPDRLGRDGRRGTRRTGRRRLADRRSWNNRVGRGRQRDHPQMNLPPCAASPFANYPASDESRLIT
jgi:hypothetical protein